MIVIRAAIAFDAPMTAVAFRTHVLPELLIAGAGRLATSSFDETFTGGEVVPATTPSFSDFTQNASKSLAP